MGTTVKSFKEEEPEMKEILLSDLAYSFMGYAYGLVEVPVDNPSWVWERIRVDPWFAMAVFRDMEEKDDMISSCLQTRKEAVLARPRRVLPASDKPRDKKVAAFIEETLETYFDPEKEAGGHFGFDAALYEMLDAIGKGVSIGEIIWGAGSDRIYVDKVKFKPQHLFSFSPGTLGSYYTASYLLPEDGPLRIRPGILLDGLESGEVLPQKKFLVRTHQPMLSNRWGTPQDRWVFWLSAFKRGAIKNWLKFLEKGTGSVHAKYPDGAPEAEKQAALSAARMINEEAAGASSASTQVDVLQHVRASGGTYKEMTMDLCNAGIARVFLGQTLTSHGSEGGAGSKALGQVHNEVRLEKVRVDARGLMATVNPGLVWPLTLFNFGPKVQPPRWVVDHEPPVDLSAMTEVWARVQEMGLPVSKSYVYKTAQMPPPEDEEDTLEAPQPTPPGVTDAGVDTAAETSDAAFSESHKKAHEEKKTLKGGRMADVQQSAKEARDLEQGVLAEARPAWRRMMTAVVDRLESLKVERFEGLRERSLDTLLATKEMAELAGVLAEGVLGAYLLGVDQIGWENRGALKGRQIQFAEAQTRPIEFGFDVAPHEAVKHFKAKKIVKRATFDELEDEAKSGSFTVAGVYRKQVLGAFKGAISEALESGATQQETIKKFRAIVAGDAKQQTLGAYHMETVFRTNVQMSYGVGRRKSMEAVADVLPYWAYHAVGDDRTRPQHQALSGVTLKSDNPFWETHYPPWAFSCRCSVTADSEMPEGYNAVNPTEGVTIAYGDDGAPAKAEIGTQVVDFSPGSFVGVPAQGGLREVMERGASTMRGADDAN